MGTPKHTPCDQGGNRHVVACKSRMARNIPEASFRLPNLRDAEDARGKTRTLGNESLVEH